MACQCAPALLQARNELNDLFPDRDKASDGCCGDADHASRTSDHNPNLEGYARAYDYDEDISQVMGDQELQGMALVLLGDKRTKYLIYEAQLLYPDGTVKPYTGINAHRHHLHHSIHDWAVLDKSPWGIARAFNQEDDMPTAEEVARATVDLLNKEGTAFGLLGFGATVVESLNVGRQNANSLAVLLSREPDEVTAADIAAAIPDGLAQDVAEALADRLAD